MPVAQETAAQSPLAQATERRVSEKRAGLSQLSGARSTTCRLNPRPSLARDRYFGQPALLDLPETIFALFVRDELT